MRIESHVWRRSGRLTWVEVRDAALRPERALGLAQWKIRAAIDRVLRKGSSPSTVRGSIESKAVPAYAADHLQQLDRCGPRECV